VGLLRFSLFQDGHRRDPLADTHRSVVWLRNALRQYKNGVARDSHDGPNNPERSGLHPVPKTPS
jgi:hypothetical protein